MPFHEQRQRLRQYEDSCSLIPWRPPPDGPIRRYAFKAGLNQSNLNGLAWTAQAARGLARGFGQHRIDGLLATEKTTIFSSMSTNVLKVPLVPDYISCLEAHFMREFAAGVQDWAHCVGMLTAWEDEYLLDNPTLEHLAAHKETIERLLRFGRVIALATGHAEFPDRNVADIVSATQSCLNDKLALWHGLEQSEERRREILKACLNEP